MWSIKMNIKLQVPSKTSWPSVPFLICASQLVQNIRQDLKTELEQIDAKLKRTHHFWMKDAFGVRPKFA